jgi:hypothetical protein
MKEPKKFKLNPETPTHKDVNKTPLPPLYKPEWDISGIENINDTYIPSDSNEDNPQDHS